MSANLFGKPKAPSTNLNISKSIVGTQKTPDQLAAEAEAEKERLANANAIEMKTFKPNVDTTGVGGRRRKSRRGKSRKYKRTLKRRKNKTKNRK